MAIVREDLDALNIRLTVRITKEDYIGVFQNKLKEYRSKAQLKGFRSGKTPMSVIRRMFGSQILIDVINEHMQEEVSNFLYNGEDKFNFLGQPIPSEHQESYDFNVSSLKEFQFQFDLGLVPEFEIKGIENEHPFDYLTLNPDPENLAEDLLEIRRKMGKSSEEEIIEEEDIITLDAIELEDGEPKVDGINREFTLFIKNTTEKTRAAFMGKGLDERLELNVFELEENTTKDHVRRYILNIEDEHYEPSPVFALTVKKISRFSLAELDEAFFEEAFGKDSNIHSEEEALAKLKTDQQQYMAASTEGLLFRDMQNYLLEQNPIDLPEKFLKRWLLFSNDNNTIASIEEGFDSFSEGLRWTILRNKLIEYYKLSVPEEEVKQGFTNRILSYFGANTQNILSGEVLDNIVTSAMKKEKDIEEMYNELMNEKIKDALKKGYELREKLVDEEELQAIVKATQKEDEEATEFDLLGEEEE